MTEYRNKETMKSVIDDIESQGDDVFKRVFKEQLWAPIVLSAAMIFVAVVYLFLDTNPVNKTLDVALSLILVIMTWGNRYSYAKAKASDSKYAHAMSYLDNLEDDEDEPDA